MDVLTDGNGRFVFHSLPAGSYSLAASRPGYLRAQYGQTQPPSAGSAGLGRRLELTDGQRLTNVAMKIWKYASISGRLVDEAGEPAVGATLYVVQETGSQTAGRYALGNSASTDDRGMFRFGELSPGSYFVMFPTNIVSVPTSVVDGYMDATSQGPPSANPIYRDLQASGISSIPSSGRRIGDQLVEMRQGDGMPQLMISETGATSVYPITFYPGVRMLGSATAITLESGQDRAGVDFAVRPVPATTVTGRVVGPDGPAANLAVKLTPPGPAIVFFSPRGGDEVATAVTRADGTFTFIGVPAGTYTATVLKVPTANRQQQSQPTSVINVGGGTSSMSSGSSSPPAAPTEPMMWGRTPVSVGESPVEGVAVRLALGLTVSGRIEFESGATTPLPTPDQLQRTRAALTPVDVVAVTGPATPTIGSDGTFKTQGTTPGRYHLTIVAPAPGWSLKSVMVAGRNVLYESLDLTSSDLNDVVVTFTDKAGEISGTVAGSTPDTDVMVAAFPVDYQSWIQAGMNPRALPSAPVRDGIYRLPGVLAGDYLVVAVSSATLIQALQNPQTMASIAKQGTRLTIGERDKRTLSLTVVRCVGHDQPQATRSCRRAGVRRDRVAPGRSAGHATSSFGRNDWQRATWRCRDVGGRIRPADPSSDRPGQRAGTARQP